MECEHSPQTTKIPYNFPLQGEYRSRVRKSKAVSEGGSEGVAFVTKEHKVEVVDISIIEQSEESFPGLVDTNDEKVIFTADLNYSLNIRIMSYSIIARHAELDSASLVR